MSQLTRGMADASKHSLRNLHRGSVLCHLVGHEAVVRQHRLGRHVADGPVDARLLGLHEQHLRMPVLLWQNLECLAPAADLRRALVVHPWRRRRRCPCGPLSKSGLIYGSVVVMNQSIKHAPGQILYASSLQLAVFCVIYGDSVGRSRRKLHTAGRDATLVWDMRYFAC